MEYLLELLEGDDLRLRSGRRLSRTGVWDTDAEIGYEVTEEDAERTSIITLPETPDEPLLPVAASGTGGSRTAPTSQDTTDKKSGTAVGRPDTGDGLTFDDPSMDWTRDDDPFAGLGPIDPEGTDDPRPRGSGGPSRRR